MRFAGPVHRLRRAADIVRTGHAEALTARQLAAARLPAAFALDPVETFRQAVRVHHQIVRRESRRAQKVGAAHRERIELKRGRHFIEQAFEGEPHVEGAVAAEGTAWRRVGENTLADIFDVVDVVDGVEQRAGIDDRHAAAAAMRPPALHAFALDARDAAVLAPAALEPDTGLRSAAPGDAA